MKSYLSLIPITAKVRKRQNRMTMLCIIFAVFLVTAIFSVADMMIRAQTQFMLDRHGNWHIQLTNLPQDTAEEIKKRSNVTAVGISSVFNFNGDQPYYINEKRAVLYGTEATYLDQISNGIMEGRFPQSDSEVLLSPNAKIAFQVQLGDRVTLHTPVKDVTLTISGFGTDDKIYYEDQTFLVGVYLTQEAFASFMEQNSVTDSKPSYYLQFEDAAKASKAIPELQSQYQLSKEDISENTGVMGMAGQSENETAKNWYGMAAILFVLVLLAGVLMISGSMNSNIAQRTQFFGMMRCIGASRQQIIRFVRLEALNWCKTAVPVGILLGTIISWGICAALHYGIGDEFETMPVFKISPAGLLSGAVIGVVTVLLAAQSPAKRASRVSPMSAVSGSDNRKDPVRRAARSRRRKIDCSLGIQHAMASKKSWCLLTASFALSILLFLSFSVILDFAKLLMPSQAPTSADMVLNGYANALVLDRQLVKQIKEINGVSNAYGCNYRDSIPATSSREGIDQINIVSYDDTLLDYARESLVQGDLSDIYGDSHKVATVFNKDNPLKVGDTIRVAGQEIEVSCALSQGLFGDSRIVICSQETYDRLVGEENYCLIGVQLGKGAAEETASQIRSFENNEIIVSDQREENRRNTTTYYASRIIAYGFLSIIAIIALFNIINSISMSVSARTKQYGAMRAVGMDNRQLTRMISAEAFTYAVSGMIVGFGTGIPLSRFLYTQLITRHCGIPWHFPMALSAVVVLFVIVSAFVAVHTPVKRIQNMAITDTINEL